MKYIQITIIVLFALSCGKKDTIELTGKIGKKAYGEISLEKKKNRVKGEYKDLKNKSKILIEGTLWGEDLRLEEYAEKDKLTGVFEGKFRNDVYKGNWINPDKTMIVPFYFEIKKASQSKRVKKDIIEIYSAWANKKNRSDPDLCTDDECKKNIKLSERGLDIDACLIKIPENINRERIILGDINDDGIEDGVISVGFEECIPSRDIGIAMKNILISHETILLISEVNSYNVIDDLPNIYKYLGKGVITKIENGVLIGKGKANSGEEDVLYWELDLEWEVKLKFDGNKLNLISKSEERNIYEE